MAGDLRQPHPRDGGGGWPCRTRRQELQAEYEDAPISLALYMGSLVAASQDMGWAPAGLLHRRFLGWVR
ncbi:hypothetical protein ABZ524_17500 [Micromonospora chersina]